MLWVKQNLRSLRHLFRYAIVFVTFLMLGSLMIGPDVFSYTMLYMEEQSTNDSTFRIYNDDEKNYLLTATAVGTLIGMYPFNWLFSRYGARYTIICAGLLSTISTCLVPDCIDFSMVTAVIIRCIQGISYSADFSLVGLIVTRWSPISETAIILSLLSSFTVIKAAVEMPLAGYMLGAYGWRSVYFAMGGIAFGSTLLWTLIYSDHPRDSVATSIEIARIERGKERTDNTQITVPYKAILTDVRVYALWIAAFVDTTASIMMMTYSAKFFAKIGYNPGENAIAVSLPGYAFLVGKIASGIASDSLRCVSEATKIRLFTFISLQLSAFVLLVIGLITPGDRTLQLILQIIFQFLIGGNVGAFYKGGVLMSGPYAFFVIGNVQLFKSLSSLLEPLLFIWIVHDDEFYQWQTFFYIHVGLLTLGNICYQPFVHAQLRPYAKESFRRTEDNSAQSDCK